jgi:CDP-4-dehydro-6-deoxyglucose reductase, E1
MIRLIKSPFYKSRHTTKKLSQFVRNTDWFSFGDSCLRFEDAFASYQKRKHCIMVNSGSSANLALLQALLNLGRLKKGDMVGFSAVTWSTNVMPIIQLGLIPIPVDVSLATLNVTPMELTKVIEKWPLKAFFATHILGMCDDMPEIVKLCKTHNVLLLEDTCESLGTAQNGTLLGNFGLASTFSYYVGHHLSTIEGGSVCTNDQELAEMLRVVRAHGWDRNLSLKDQGLWRKRFNINSEFYSRYTFYDLGFNLRPTEIAGFLGLIQLEYMSEIIQKRESNYNLLKTRVFDKNNAFNPIDTSHLSPYSSFAIPVVVKNIVDFGRLVDICKDVIEIRPLVGGDITQQPFFKKYSSYNDYPLPNARLLHTNALYIGNNPEMTKAELRRIQHILLKI